ncbi:MAG: hypothetical protein SO141_05820 [Alphaproteobacteria bacterium]|nr:hypothetical protein [Alphaproteobacteria bacterium]
MKTQYKNFISKVNQTGSLMIEAMAMLALISLVTPTLYKKSAERTTELQDINTATHVRTIMKAVDNYVTANYQSLLEDQLRNDGAVYEVDLEHGGTTGGIHDFFPYGYKFDDLKNFGMPKVMLKRQGLSITSFVQLPKKSDIGEMRAARIASMIGSNGGYVTDSKNAQGVGGVWSLTQADLDALGFDTNKGSVVVASSDAINSASSGALENEKYLQRTRVDSQDQLWRNTMVTDLYMGGVTGVDDMYKILGVDQLIMGSTDTVNNTESLVLTEDAQGGGSAWMAGALSALNNAFKLEGDADNPTLTLTGNSGTIMSADTVSFDLYPGYNGADGTVGLEVEPFGQTVTTDYSTTVKNDLTATGNTAVATGGVANTFKAGPDGSYITAENEKVSLQGGQLEVLANGENGVSTTNIKTANTNLTGNVKVGVGDVAPTVVNNPRLNVQGDAYVANNLEVGNTLYTQKFNAAELHAGGDAANSADNERWLHATRTGVTVTSPDTKNTRMVISADETGLYNQEGRESTESSAVVLGASGASLRAKQMAEVYTTDTDGNVKLQENALIIDGKTTGDNKADITANANDINFNAATTSVNDGIFQVRGATADSNQENSFYVNTENNGLVLAEANRTTIKPRGDGGAFDVRDSADRKILNVMPNGLEATADEKGYPYPIGTVDIDSQSFSLSDMSGVGHRILEVDIDNSLTQATNNENSTRGSVYVRRGAVELESPSGTGYEADAGVGYIEAGRFVANTKFDGTKIDNPTDAYSSDYTGAWNTTGRVAYDRYMVNPAYTSVMHDIKLTTRGGARLSDILPDFINKGIYVVNNTYVDTGFSLDSIVAKGNEGGRITVSANAEVKDIDTIQGSIGGKNLWASPFMGVVPAPICPPGHARVITITPAGFLMSQAGQMVKEEHYVGDKRFVIDETKELNKLGDVNLPDNETTITGAYSTSTSIADAAGNSRQIYYLGHSTEPSATYGGSPYSPTPLYFQQSTWLKSRVQPQDNDKAGSCNQSLGSGEGCTNFVGWSAIMGFAYPVSLYKNIIQNIIGSLPEDGDVYWNIFPVRVKTLEAYATVYCYFDRTNLYNSGLKDQYTDKYDQLNNFRMSTSGNRTKDSTYLDRLDDPSLKYKEPW